MIKVLYIEDNDDNIYMLKMRLELLDEFEVLTAEDGEKGCEMAAAERPDIVLMDLEMPGIDGWEATRRLKSNPDTRDIPVIVVTSRDLDAEDRARLNSGVQSVLVKETFRPAELVERIRRLVHGKPPVVNAMEAAS